VSQSPASKSVPSQSNSVSHQPSPRSSGHTVQSIAQS